jgi:hypothetical protein
LGFLSFPGERSHQIAVVTGGRFPPLQQITTISFSEVPYLKQRQNQLHSIQHAVQMSKDNEAVNVRDFT